MWWRSHRDNSLCSPQWTGRRGPAEVSFWELGSFPEGTLSGLLLETRCGDPTESFSKAVELPGKRLTQADIVEHTELLNTLGVGVSLCPVPGPGYFTHTCLERERRR